jgi:hypothetical protein
MLRNNAQESELSLCLQEYDADGVWLKYALERAQSPEAIKALADFFKREDGGKFNAERRKWLTFDVFKVMVANALQCQYVIPPVAIFCSKEQRFEAATNAGSLHCFLTNAFLLHQYKLPLDEERLSLAIITPEYSRAVAVCIETGFMDAESCLKSEKHQTLCSNNELMFALAVLRGILNKNAQYDQILSAINTLFRIAESKSSETVLASNSLFKSENRLSCYGDMSKVMSDVLRQNGLKVDGALHYRLGFH